MLCALAPCINEGIICYLSIERCNGDVFVCVQLNTPLSSHRNKVYEYCNKSAFEVTYKILKTLRVSSSNEVTSYVNLDLFKYCEPYSKAVFSSISGFHHG